MLLYNVDLVTKRTQVLFLIRAEGHLVVLLGRLTGGFLPEERPSNAPTQLGREIKRTVDRWSPFAGQSGRLQLFFLVQYFNIMLES